MIVSNQLLEDQKQIDSVDFALIVGREYLTDQNQDTAKTVSGTIKQIEINTLNNARVVESGRHNGLQLEPHIRNCMSGHR